MHAGEQEPTSVPVDVLPPLPKDTPRSTPPADRPADPPTPFAGLRTFYHPASGVVILGIDVLVFGPEMLSGFLDTPVMCAIAFLTTLPLVWIIQSKWSKDTGATAFGKAFLGAFLAGLPFSIAGTMLGAAVLALSGLPHHPVDMVKKLTAPQGDPAQK
jgi:hypothetical protein